MKKKTYSVKKLAELLGGEIKNESISTINGVSSFFQATEEEVTFAADLKYIKKLNKTKAGVVIVPPLEEYSEDKTYIIVNSNPRELMPKIFNFFKRTTKKIIKQIEDSAIVGENTTILHNVYIGHDVVIGNNCIIHPNVVIYEGTKIGDNCEIFANVTIREFCIIGKNCTIQPGAVIGGDGFGYVLIDGKNAKIEQLGTVVIEDNVDIGSNTTIDRGAIGNTIIKEHTKIDNLVQIGHNNIIGENCIIISQVGIAGSTEVGKNTTLAGQVGVAGHLKIGDNVTVGAKSGVHCNVKSNQTVLGTPLLPRNEALKIRASVKKLPELLKRVKDLEKKEK